MVNQTAAERKRIPYIDAAKGVGIILVCIGHAITGNGGFGSTFWLGFISQFHMPFFFLISGLNFSEAYTEHPVSSGWKKIKAYYVPFAVYNMIFVLLHNVMAGWGIFPEYLSIQDTVKSIFMVLTFHIQEICGAMWFLRTLLTILLIFIVIRSLVNRLAAAERREWVTAGAVLVLVILSMLGWVTEVFKINLAFYYLLFFYAGFLIRKYDLIRYIRKYQWRWILVGAGINLLFAAQSLFWIDGDGRVDIQLLRLLGQMTGSLMVLAAVQAPVLANNRLLHLLGKRSLDIMALHFVCFKLVSYLIIVRYQLDMSNMATIPVVENAAGFWWIAYTAVGLVIPIAIRWLYEKGKLFILTSISGNKSTEG